MGHGGLELQEIILVLGVIMWRYGSRSLHADKTDYADAPTEYRARSSSSAVFGLTAADPVLQPKLLDAVENYYDRYTDPKGILESWEYFMAPINVRLNSGDRFEFNWDSHGEILLAPFEIASGVVIPPGSYQFTRWRAEAQTSPHRPLQFGTTTWFGQFYNGHLTQQINYVKWTSPKGRLQLEADTENDFAHMPEGNFVQKLWQLQAAYAWSPNLVLTSFVQYDTESRNVGTNTRLRWTIKPDNDLFIVWNRGWQKLITRPELSLIPQSDLIAVKLRWTFRF